MATIISIPAITVPAVLLSNNIKKYDRHKFMDLTDLKNLSLDGHRLADEISDIYPKLSIEAQDNKDVSDFISDVKTLDKAAVMDTNKMIEKIYNLPISGDLKIFMTENLLEKQEIQKSRDSDVMETIPKSVENVLVNPAPSLRDYDAPSNNARFVLDHIETHVDLPGWDINWDVGDKDLITGKFFSRYLGEIIDQRGAGWKDDGPDSYYAAHRVSFYFKDLVTNELQNVSLYYNAAKDTDGLSNEDYAFVAIEPQDASHVISDDRDKNEKVPTIFGQKLNFRFMNQMDAKINHHLVVDNPYMASFHENDHGEDDEWGNYLLDLKLPGGINAPAIIGREALGGMKHVARDFVSYIYKELNMPFVKELNDNYLYDSFADKTWSYVKDANGNLIPRVNYDNKDEDYNLFEDDVTVFHWSNQKIYDNVKNQSLISFNSDVQKNLGFLVGDVTSIPNTVISEVIKKTLNSTTLLNSLAKFSSFWGTSFLSSVITRDWKNNIANSIGQTAIDVITSSLIGKAGEFLFEELSSSIIAGPVGAICAQVLKMVIDLIPSGNGHTIGENYDDHGLNDWDYQWKNNAENMLLNAVTWSSEFKSGINWKVVDSWFSTPKLYIQRVSSSEKSSWFSLSGNNFINNDFNWGHKIGVHNYE